MDAVDIDTRWADVLNHVLDCVADLMIYERLRSLNLCPRCLFWQEFLTRSQDSTLDPTLNFVRFLQTHTHTHTHTHTCARAQTCAEAASAFYHQVQNSTETYWNCFHSTFLQQQHRPIQACIPNVGVCLYLPFPTNWRVLSGIARGEA